MSIVRHHGKSIVQELMINWKFSLEKYQKRVEKYKKQGLIIDDDCAQEIDLKTLTEFHKKVMKSFGGNHEQ